MLEATREQGDALCGGFVSWRTLASLDGLGLPVARLGGHPVNRVRLFAGDNYAEARLPSPAIGISRRRLDAFLTAEALAAGAGLDRGVAAAALEQDGALLLKDGTRLQPESLFIATGKHELRGLGRARFDAPTLGLRVKLPAHPALSRMIDDAIELHLFEGGYAGLLLQEDGSANLCMAVRKTDFADAGGSPAQFLLTLAAACPALGERLAFMGPSPDIDAIASIPYGWIGQDTRPGQFRLGDQAACIPSLAGEGNGLALASGIRAAAAWERGGALASVDYQRRFARSARVPVGVAKLLWHAAESPPLASLLTSAARIAPALTRLAASLTRIRH